MRKRFFLLFCLFCSFSAFAKTEQPSRFDTLLQRYFFNPFIGPENVKTIDYYRHAPGTKDSIRFPKPGKDQGAQYYQVRKQSFFKSDSNNHFKLMNPSAGPQVICAYPTQEAQREQRRRDFSCQYRASVNALPGDELSFTHADLTVDWSKNSVDDKEYDPDLFRNEIKSVTVVYHFATELDAVRAFQTMKSAFSATDAVSNNTILTERKVYAANFTRGNSFVVIRNYFDTNQYTIFITLRLVGRI
ncbi:hypothetical protein [Taibaiella soli]|uniref:Uncharacterized protein n=1 Tax=Taibaiella soli TaxID=1649169 RepID=A0A2W2B3E0_9BACT|nr:hypothetical protein [Taibaiella soli]PZF74804.1 hypothetical protein DN068_00990 [Taibaiella soli]